MSGDIVMQNSNVKNLLLRYVVIIIIIIINIIIAHRALDGCNY